MNDREKLLKLIEKHPEFEPTYVVLSFLRWLHPIYWETSNAINKALEGKEEWTGFLYQSHPRSLATHYYEDSKEVCPQWEDAETLIEECKKEVLDK